MAELTHVTEALDDSEDAVDVASSANITAGEYLLVDDEVLLVEDKEGNTLNVVRAVGHSIAATHDTSAPVYKVSRISNSPSSTTVYYEDGTTKIKTIDTFVDLSDVTGLLPTTAEKAALDAASSPSGDNAFVTAEEIADVGSGVFVGDDPPDDPSDGDLWYDTDDDTPADGAGNSVPEGDHLGDVLRLLPGDTVVEVTVTSDDITGWVDDGSNDPGGYAAGDFNTGINFDAKRVRQIIIERVTPFSRSAVDRNEFMEISFGGVQYGNWETYSPGVYWYVNEAAGDTSFTDEVTPSDILGGELVVHIAADPGSLAPDAGEVKITFRLADTGDDDSVGPGWDDIEDRLVPEGASLVPAVPAASYNSGFLTPVNDESEPGWSSFGAVFCRGAILRPDSEGDWKVVMPPPPASSPQIGAFHSILAELIIEQQGMTVWDVAELTIANASETETYTQDHSWIWQKDLTDAMLGHRANLATWGDSGFQFGIGTFAENPDWSQSQPMDMFLHLEGDATPDPDDNACYVQVVAIYLPTGVPIVGAKL